MKLTPLVFIACLPFLGCTQALIATAGSVADAAPATMLAAKKSLIAAHGLHEAAADALTAAANANICTGQCAVTSKQYLDQSEAGLKAADSLVALGDAQGIEAKISGATALIAQVQHLVSGGK